MALLALAVLAGCQVAPGAGPGRAVAAGEPLRIAMLLPVGSPEIGDRVIATGLENAARLAIADFPTLDIDLTIYDTRANADRAAAVARQAVGEGADVIVGPLRSDAAAAVALAVADSDVSILSFSNNPEIAGENLFVLGATFENAARRMLSFAARNGDRRLVLAHPQTLAGEISRDAVSTAARSARAQIVATVAFEFSRPGANGAAPDIVSAVAASDADGVVIAATSAGALPILAQRLPQSGLDPSATQLLGLTPWDRPAELVALPALQGAVFPVADPDATAQFEARYRAAFGSPAHVLAGLGYDAIRLVGETALRSGSIGARSLLGGQRSIPGASGAFRLLRDGTTDRALAIARIVDGQVTIIETPQTRLTGGGSS